MYCFRCGKQIRDDALFCQHCGAKQDSNAIASPVTQSAQVPMSISSGELNRNALKIYLGNVLSLECIKAKLERKRLELLSLISDIERNNYYKKYPLWKNKDGYAKNYAHFRFDGQKIYVACDDISYLRPYTSDRLYQDYKWCWFQNDSDVDYFKKANLWEYATDPSSGYFAKKEQERDSINAFVQGYYNFKEESPVIYQKNAKRISVLRQKYEDMLNELNKVNQLLNQAYNVNLIPGTFRNKLYAIYYLYNFVSTSQESFTTALLHCDLDEIKTKLDKIIAQQESVIIQQAIMTAQNEKLLQQNQQQLKYLSSIEQNTEQAAQYSQIAANNAEVCAWISIANYIDTRNKK